MSSATYVHWAVAIAGGARGMSGSPEVGLSSRPSSGISTDTIRTFAYGERRNTECSADANTSTNGPLGVSFSSAAASFPGAP